MLEVFDKPWCVVYKNYTLCSGLESGKHILSHLNTLQASSLAESDCLPFHYHVKTHFLRPSIVPFINCPLLFSLSNNLVCLD